MGEGRFKKNSQDRALKNEFPGPGLKKVERLKEYKISDRYLC